VLQYQWFRVVDPDGATTKPPRILVWETYADQAAVDAHKASPKMAWLRETEEKEGNMLAPPEVVALEEFAGWVSR